MKHFLYIIIITLCSASSTMQAHKPNNQQKEPDDLADISLTNKEKEILGKHYFPALITMLTNQDTKIATKAQQKINALIQQKDTETNKPKFPNFIHVHLFVEKALNQKIATILQKDKGLIIAYIKALKATALGKKNMYPDILKKLLLQTNLPPDSKIFTEILSGENLFTHLLKRSNRQTIIELKKYFDRKTWQSKFLGIVLNPPTQKPSKPKEISKKPKTPNKKLLVKAQNPKIFLPLYINKRFLGKKLSPQEEIIDALSKEIAQKSPESINKRLTDRVNRYLGKQKATFSSWIWIPWISRPRFTIKDYIQNPVDQKLFSQSIIDFILAQKEYKKRTKGAEYLYSIDKIMHDLTQLAQRNTIDIDTYTQQNKKSLFADILEEKKKLEKLVTKDKRIPFIPLEKYLMTVTTDMLALAQTIKPK